MKALIVALVFLVIAVPASAQSLFPPMLYQPYRPLVAPTLPPLPTLTVPSSGTTTDIASGNTYRWRQSVDGTTEVNGANYRTGSLWRTTITPDGSMRGTDSQSNPWQYNATTGTYINYGTGKICVGTGITRVCS